MVVEMVGIGVMLCWQGHLCHHIVVIAIVVLEVVASMLEINMRDSPVLFGPSTHSDKCPCGIVSDAKD